MIFVAPEFTDSRVIFWFLVSIIVSIIAGFISNDDKIYNYKETEYEIFKVSNTKKLLAILLGSSLGGFTALIFDSIDLDNENSFFLAPLVSFIATRIVLKSKAFNNIEIETIEAGGFFRSKIWLILQILWIVLVIMTARYDSYYPQRVYLFYSFIGQDFRTTGLIQALILALPFSTNIYYWFKK